MNKKLISTLVMTGLFCCTTLGWARENQEGNFSLPDHFAIKKLYNNDYSYIFHQEEQFFAVGKFNKKFTLKTPDGKTLSTTRLYELIPHNEPLLAVRNDEGSVLGFILVEKQPKLKLFSKAVSHVYNSVGQPFLRISFPLGGKYFKIYSADEHESLLLTTKKGVENEIIVQAQSDEAFCINPVLLATIIHIHSDKSLLSTLVKYSAIDELRLEDLKTFAYETDGRSYIKGLDPAVRNLGTTEEQCAINAIKQALKSSITPVVLSDIEKEHVAASLSDIFGDEELSLEKTQETLPLLSSEEKSLLLEIIETLEIN